MRYVICIAVMVIDIYKLEVRGNGVGVAVNATMTNDHYAK